MGLLRSVAGVTAREADCALDGVFKTVNEGVGRWNWEEECVVEYDEVIGDHGREEAIDALDKLLRYGVVSRGTGGISSRKL